jgi:hypothetical protein
VSRVIPGAQSLFQMLHDLLLARFQVDALPCISPIFPFATIFAISFVPLLVSRRTQADESQERDQV